MQNSYMYEAEPDDQFLPLREVVYKKLRHQILTGERKPGERLMEVHLAGELDVSRTPIREAIRKLELEGLVKIIPRSGAQVAEISEKELGDVLEVRRGLDTMCSQLASARITAEQKEELKNACDRFEKATKSGSSETVADADVALHEVILRACGNDKLVEILHNLADQMYRFRFEYIKDDSNLKVLVREHRELADAIIRGDAEAAGRIAAEHIEGQKKAILSQIREGNSGDVPAGDEKS